MNSRGFSRGGFIKDKTKYVTLEYCFILMSLYWMFSCFKFLILYLLPSKIDFILFSSEWILNLLSTNQSQSILKFLFSTVSISVISLCWNIKQVSSAYSNSSQSTACGISCIYNKKWSGPKMDLWGAPKRRIPGSNLNMNFELPIWQVRFKPFCSFFRESYELHFL